MTKKRMKQLLDKHYKLQMEAIVVENKILDEVRKHNPDSELLCELACTPYTEPANFADLVMEEIEVFLDD